MTVVPSCCRRLASTWPPSPRKIATSPIGSSKVRKYGPTLSESRAYRLFDNLCAKHFARAFKLYKLYERAAAFLGSGPR